MKSWSTGPTVIGKRKMVPVLLLLVLLVPFRAAGDEPAQFPTRESLESFFEPSRLQTTGGVRYQPDYFISLEPTIGLEYRKRLDDLAGGGTLTTHKLHAEAGGTVRVRDRFSFSSAARVPVSSVSRAGTAAGKPGDQEQWRVSRDLLQPGAGVGVRSEVGVKLSPRVDLNFFVDQTLLGGSAVRGAAQPEDSFGTRFIFRFK